MSFLTIDHVTYGYNPTNLSSKMLSGQLVKGNSTALSEKAAAENDIAETGSRHLAA